MRKNKRILSRNFRHAAELRSFVRLSASQCPRFTLIELLVVIAIIA
ncbi:MAG: prepilin-type N-terminal cleavage/methylation domain-containing protein, partial [Victivallales bacterium]|nr:prepilin-type N-terminal cleavage/methylation domain-containing protein [Victivallales bacterium]